MLKRTIAYGNKVYGLDKIIEGISDRRVKPRIKTSHAFESVFLMSLCRLGSINSLVNNLKKSPSHSSIGRIFCGINCDDIRKGMFDIYTTLRKNKALEPSSAFLVVDGHETSASYLRNCEGCLERKVKTKNGTRIQYYHRNVTALLVSGRFKLPIDAEAQLPHEDEVAAAKRLLKRVCKVYPRAFKIVVADALYAQAPFFNMVAEMGKYAIAVLKDERRDLLEDAKGLCKLEKPMMIKEGKTEYMMWDFENMTTWAELKRPVRVVRSFETKTVTRQINKKNRAQTPTGSGLLHCQKNFIQLML